MGREIVYCDVCGDRILEADFEKGKAFDVQNRSYCPRCVDKAPARPPPPPRSSPPGKSSGAHRALRAEPPSRVARPGSSGKTSGALPSVRAETPGRSTPRHLSPPTSRKSQTGRVPPATGRGPRPAKQGGPPRMLLIVVGVIAVLVLLIIIIVVVSRGRVGRQAAAEPPGPPPHTLRNA